MVINASKLPQTFTLINTGEDDVSISLSGVKQRFILSSGDSARVKCFTSSELLNFLAQETETLRIVEGEPDGDYWTCNSEGILPTEFFEKRGPEGYKFWCWLDKDNNIVSDENPVPAGRYRATWIKAWFDKISIRIPFSLRFEFKIKFSNLDFTEILSSSLQGSFYAKFGYGRWNPLVMRNWVNFNGIICTNFVLGFKNNKLSSRFIASRPLFVRLVIFHKFDLSLNIQANAEVCYVKNRFSEELYLNNLSENQKIEMLSWPMFNSSPASVQSISTQSLEEKPVKRKSSKADKGDNDIDISQLATFEE